MTDDHLKGLSALARYEHETVIDGNSFCASPRFSPRLLASPKLPTRLFIAEQSNNNRMVPHYFHLVAEGRFG
ncbi:hypothetical protein [Rhizobium sp. Root483D2]|uniref:hypothetical protein n=1 Tax=Rhizobium sp. Root483D2 TaxID=1736545 RepID=UPI00138EF166|nr:hypothetical protein [Rhizobium sp. Root483D2]